MKNLPIGIQNIEEVINNYLYVDKTGIVYKLISEGKYYFLSRPRRFGKSLLISTLEQIFKGNKELFKGLDIYDKIDSKEYPVIRLDFSRIDSSESREIFIKNIESKLDMTAQEYGYDLTKEGITNKIEELIISLSKKNKVVILVDEYDKPIVDYITDIKKAQENREVMRQLYLPLKGLDEYIKFVFLTGVSRFSKVSIFSGLNNLRDITLSREFSSLCGITQTELETNFNEYINKAMSEMKENRAELLNKIKDFYNGYSWDGQIRVYNPFSILNFFADLDFKNYWFDTGTPTFLINLFKHDWFDVSALENISLDNRMIESYDIDNMNIVPLLLQTGYLTIQSITKGRYGQPVYMLDYPNIEVRESMFANLINSYSNLKNDQALNFTKDLLEAIEGNNIEKFTNILKSIFAGIPSILQSNQKESYFHSMFYLILRLIGAEIDLEVLTDKGRIDAVLKLDKKIFVIEFKIGSEQEAMNQIKHKKYYEKFLGENKEIYLLGVGGFEKKDIKCILERV